MKRRKSVDLEVSLHVLRDMHSREICVPRPLWEGIIDAADDTGQEPDLIAQLLITLSFDRRLRSLVRQIKRLTAEGRIKQAVDRYQRSVDEMNVDWMADRWRVKNGQHLQLVDSDLRATGPTNPNQSNETTKAND